MSKTLLVPMLTLSACLTACATVPRPVQVLEVCPRLPALESVAPERDWQKEMENFLRGTLPTQDGSKQPMTNAAPGTRLPAQR